MTSKELLDRDRAIFSGGSCPECWYQWEILDDVIEKCEDVDYYQLAMRAMTERRNLDVYRLSLKDLCAAQVLLIDIADGVIVRHQKERQYRDSRRTAEG
jgi:hypothetical protein